MVRKVVIEPVTRIEGHAKVVVHLNDDNQVERAYFHVNEFRGFEKFCEGRMFFEMPQITERICGICPVSHHLVSVKACDQILGVEVPRPAQLLRELMHMGQTIQSHSMHFFELAGPDLLLGFDADPAIRNVAGLYAASPELVGKAIRLRDFQKAYIRAVYDKQDCEIKAFHRLEPKLRRLYPQISLWLLLDGLYADQNVIRPCVSQGWNAAITFKESDMPALWTEAQSLLALCPAQHRQKLRRDDQDPHAPSRDIGDPFRPRK